MDYSDFRIPYLDLEQQLERIDFSQAEVPEYMNVNYPTIGDLQDKLSLRLPTTLLQHFYQSFVKNSYQEYMEVQTFTHLMVVTFQQGIDIWRYYSFQVFNNKIAKKFKVTPPGQKVLSPYDPQKSNAALVREYINWKRLMTMFILISSPLPTRQDIQTYHEKLLEQVSSPIHHESSQASIPTTETTSTIDIIREEDFVKVRLS